jgi:hypothetical protein
MKSLIVGVSIPHGNTRRVADRMAEVLRAEVVDPETLHEHDERDLDRAAAPAARLRDRVARAETPS